MDTRLTVFADVFGFDGSQASHAALVQAFKCILRDGDDLYLLGCVNDPTEVEGISGAACPLKGQNTG